MDVPVLGLRVAVRADAPAIDTLMSASISAIFPAYYDAGQGASSIVHVGHVDDTLIADGTYFVIESGDGIVACGGWSRREKLFTGSDSQEGRARLLDPLTEAARVRAMFVREEWTRRGLGTRILDACEAAARREGFRTLALVTWSARYLRCVESIGGAHPDGERYRSPLALLEQDSGYWAVYWHVDQLRKLAPSERPLIASLRGLGKHGAYKRPFEPEGPILIEPVQG